MAAIVLLADDLTGASDTGVQLVRRGLRTVVFFDLPDPSTWSELDAVAVDTHSRHLPADVAYERVRRAAERLQEAAPRHVYKKVDSTLRGNVGVEIDAVMDAFGYEMAAVAPAFPRLGRTTVSGVHYLNGVPVAETDVGRDPIAPVHESNLVQLLGSQSRRSAGLVDVSALDIGPEAIRDRVEQLADHGARILVFDAQTESHLQQVADALASWEKRFLWVGSAGLAEHLPDALGLQGRASGEVSATAADSPILLVVGSASSVTREQVAVLRAHPSVDVVDLDPLRIASGGSVGAVEARRLGDLLISALVSGRDAALVAGTGMDAVAEPAVADERTSSLNVAQATAAALGEVAGRAISAQRIGGLVLTGGDTARAVCQRLGVTGIQLLGEVEPGVPLGRLTGGGGWLAVTKAGAFGSAGTLVHALRALKRE